jgi:hypothetical protein
MKKLLCVKEIAVKKTVVLVNLFLGLLLIIGKQPNYFALTTQQKRDRLNKLVLIIENTLKYQEPELDELDLFIGEWFSYHTQRIAEFTENIYTYVENTVQVKTGTFIVLLLTIISSKSFFSSFG